MAGQQRVKDTKMLTQNTLSSFDHTITDASFNTSTQAGLEAWIYWHYCHKGFHYDGTYKSLVGLRDYLFALDPSHSRKKIRQTIFPLLHPKHKYTLVKADKNEAHTSEKMDDAARIVNSQPNTKPTNIDAPKATFLNSLQINQATPATYPSEEEDENLTLDNKDYSTVSNVLNAAPTVPCSKYLSEDNITSVNGNWDAMDLLLSNDSGNDDTGECQVSKRMAQMQHAPLITANIISSGPRHLLPQYGLIGSHEEPRHTKSKLFLNTNVPFSIFLCEVQGSGKSHTTSCILENSLVPSKLLGKLQSPLSTLVFSYGQFSGDGAGFNISESAFLASPDPRVPGGAHVKKVHVLVSPSNYVRISKLYLQLPNVTVTPFKVKSRSLDINTMLTLMNVGESNETPLYMAQVTQILREMSTAGGPFDYRAFKMHLEKQEFNPTQTNMLRMRLNLLESFLDMDDSSLEPQFRPGEITIMDMSCPFVDANTACILFRIGLQRHLQSKGTGKIIVLDEAHKYMLNTPGAKSLNEMLLQTIRLQRHYGARVVVSTQEPTLLTDLIALCSVIIIHRFSSPEWFSAIKRHIPIAAENRDSLMQRIEGLTTGTAIIYSSNAIIGRDECGNIVTGTGRMIKVSIRKRITSDGGQSVLAV